MASGHRAFNGKENPSLSIPQSQSPPNVSKPGDLSPGPTTPTTPKTPADEALEFFSSTQTQGAATITVYELRLDPDGGPNKDRQVRSSTLDLLQFH